MNRFWELECSHFRIAREFEALHLAAQVSKRQLRFLRMKTQGVERNLFFNSNGMLRSFEIPYFDVGPGPCAIPLALYGEKPAVTAPTRFKDQVRTCGRQGLQNCETWQRVDCKRARSASHG